MGGSAWLILSSAHEAVSRLDRREGDLDAVFLYWARRAGVDIADRLIDAITGRFWIIGEYPDAGRACEDIAPGMQCFPAGKYLIYYRKMRRRVEIAHVFHGSRNQKNAWKEIKA